MNRHADKRVRNAAMMLKGRNWALEVPEHVAVGSLGGQRHRKRGVRRLAIESRAPHAGAGKHMSEWVQGSIEGARLHKPLKNSALRRFASGHDLGRADKCFIA